MVAILQTEEFL